MDISGAFMEQFRGSRRQYSKLLEPGVFALIPRLYISTTQVELAHVHVD